jgi:hypothetical protein
MDGVHEMAAELFLKIMADRQARGMHTADDALEAARDSYVYAKAFFEEHGRHLERGHNAFAGSQAGLHVAGVR